LYFGDQVDYSTLPPAWERYSADDQARILSRLLAIRDAGANTQGLPETINTLRLTEALQQWNNHP
jgi:hypothetical protein